MSDTPTTNPRGPFAATCPTRDLLDQIADKWSMLVLIALADAPCRFNALRRKIEGISQKVLTQTLRRLERNGLVDRRVEATVPVSVTYSLSDLGRSLAEMLETVRRWSIDNIGRVDFARRAYDRQA